MARPEPPLREPEDREGVAADMAAFGVCYIRIDPPEVGVIAGVIARDWQVTPPYARELARQLIEALDEAGWQITPA